LASAYYSRTYNPSYGRVARPQRGSATADENEAEAEAEAEVKQVIIAGEVFERHAHLLRDGQEAEFRVPHLPGRVWKGTVRWLDPEVDPTKRTFLFSMEADDPDDVLKTNMRGHVTLFTEPQRDMLIIPREALIVTGGSQRVVVALGEGRFQPREVIAGVESSDRVAVLSGLEEGENLVASAQFLLDSEANLQAGLQRLADAQGAQEASR
jgi:Cu(I)/Ag(I) efflux system membrane fusion protein